MKYWLFVGALVSVMSAKALTEGWENVNPNRQEIAPAKVLWQADFNRPEAFRLRTVGGAKGKLDFVKGLLTIRKLNDEGILFVESEVRLAQGARLRFLADFQTLEADDEASHAMLRARDEDGSYPHFEGLNPIRGSDSLVSGGPEIGRGLLQSPPQTFARKYGHWITKREVTTVAIVVSGKASVSVWRNWLAEDCDAAQAKWQALTEKLRAHDHASERMDEAAFDRMIAKDVNHVAEMREVEGVTRLFIDGKVAPAIAYKGKHSFAKDALVETFAGQRVLRAGVPIMVRTLNLGLGVDPRRYWTSQGFDAKGAVRDIKDAMRIAPEALCFVGLNCNVYPEFTQREHPEEAWVRKDGRVLMGRGGTIDDNDDMGIRDDRRWPWVSMASTVWREAIKRCIRELVAELKVQGLDKRVVGLHLCGFGDGQFYSPVADYSQPAQRRYQSWLKEGNHVSTNYVFYTKQLGMDAQNEFAREFKHALGKPAVAVRWCCCEFIGSHDIVEFERSGDLDVIVAQPAYTRRQPGISAMSNLPTTSFARHGKMFWMEFDLRTYAAIDTWAVSVVAAKGAGNSDDIEMWRSAYRKYAGIQLATNSGWWFYDMGGGWYDRPEIADDIALTVKVASSLVHTPVYPWRPSVAVVYDEKGLIGWDGGEVPLNDYTHFLFPYQQRRFAQSGVPYDFYLAEDVMDDPSLLKDHPVVVFANFRKLDARRGEFIKALSKTQRTLVFLAETGVLGGSELCGFKTEYDPGRRPHVVLPEKDCPYDSSSLVWHCSLRDWTQGTWPMAEPQGPRGTVAEAPGIKVLARFKEDSKPALALKVEGAVRKFYCCEPSGISAGAFNQIVREAGGYVPSPEPGLQVDMSGNFLSVHALRNGKWNFRLPFTCAVRNLKSGKLETVVASELPLELTAGETCWFAFEH